MTECSGLLLIDTDMLILLLASDMLERVAESLGYSPLQLRRLSAVPHQIRKSKRFRDNYGQAILQRIEPMVAAIPEADAPIDLELLDTLKSFVDEGEAQLMALAAAQQCTLLISGDKRAIAGLVKSGVTECIDALRGKVVSLEAVLWILLEKLTALEVRDAFRPVLDYSTLRIVLSDHAIADRARCLEGIRSYYEDLYRGASGVLYNPSASYLGIS